jgi:hypothetical protein
MQTPAHLIFGMTAFGKAHQPAVTVAAFVGALIPDLSLYLMAGTHLFILGTPPDVVFGELYFSRDWHNIFRIDNSFVLWGIAFGIAFMLRNTVAMALCGAALLHLVLDFPLHHDDGRAHFWPISDWIFASPVSYWDMQHHAGWVIPAELVAAVACCVLFWRRHVDRRMRAFVLVLGAAQLVPVIGFAIMFAGQ